MNEGKHMSEALPLGLLLALTGGILDAYTYLNRGAVFATAETGNLVLLGINLAMGHWLKVIYYLLPISSYAAGLLVTLAFHRRSDKLFFHWRQFVVLTECLVVLLATIIPQGELDPLVNCMIAFISAMQVQTFRKFRGCACATTMCTGNLRSGVEALYFHLADKEPGSLDRAKVYFGLIAFFVTGAVISSLLAPLFAGRAILVAILPLAASFLLMFF
ncbi:MAG: DUF1275 domain-containing protein [Clostridiales bacterium]|nr:DUF1275 domain-containing protein [Clostridiales bacterium]